MGKNRIEAFSDGVLAIIITIMVLELKVPHGAEFRSLLPLIPVFCSYVLSFLYVGIYWNNHHHLFHVTRSVSGSILWANLHLLFWLSLFPFTTAWVGEDPVAPAPAAAYGFVLLMASMAFNVLQRRIVVHEGRDSLIASALGRDWKGKISILLYVLGMALAFFSAWISSALYAFVALYWLIPDRRMERGFAAATNSH
ncbi:MAG: DUF1211 domain-containing protein [Bryobacteraceae bacterium]|nr:DUF1211 domain-containing protein [Bryobacteraceae bacterium]